MHCSFVEVDMRICGQEARLVKDTLHEALLDQRTRLELFYNGTVRPMELDVVDEAIGVALDPAGMLPSTLDAPCVPGVNKQGRWGVPWRVKTLRNTSEFSLAIPLPFRQRSTFQSPPPALRWCSQGITFARPVVSPCEPFAPSSLRSKDIIGRRDRRQRAGPDRAT